MLYIYIFEENDGIAIGRWIIVTNIFRKWCYIWNNLHFPQRRVFSRKKGEYNRGSIVPLRTLVQSVIKGISTCKYLIYKKEHL